jgi:hypothetical protein
MEILFIGLMLDTDLRKRYLCSDLVTCGRIPWKSPTSSSRGDWCWGGEVYRQRTWLSENVGFVADISEDAVAGITVAAGLKVCSWDLVYGGTWIGVLCCWYFPLCVNKLDVPISRADHVGVTNLWRVSPQVIKGCRWYALLLASSVITQLALCGALGGALDVTGRRLIAMAGRL